MNQDYAERVYAAVLGKHIGVRLGAPVEAVTWTYERIRAAYGDRIHGYLRPYRVFGADDDLNGPAYFFQVLEEMDDPQIADFARAWVDAAREGKGFFWWGGIGRSTSHTVYALLRGGTEVPLRKEAVRGMKDESESVGGQIFVDYLGLCFPGNEARAAELGGRLAAVAHFDDGVWGGRFMAAACAAALDSQSVEEVLDRALAQIPENSDYSRVVRAVRAFHAQNADWRACRDMLERDWGYDRYSGICPMIPNAGVCAMALLYSGGQASLGMEIATMASWDTDCNAGNVGAILGALQGLAGIEPCYRDPFHDVGILSGVSGDANICDLPSLACRIARRGYALAGEPLPDALRPVPAALCFSFPFAGCTQGWQADNSFVLQISGAPAPDGTHALKAVFNRLKLGQETRLFYRSFYTRDAFEDERYSPVFTPKVWPGQVLTLRLYSDQWGGASPLRLTPYVRTAFDGRVYKGEEASPLQREWQTLRFPLPDTHGGLIEEIGLLVASASENTGEASRDLGCFYLSDIRVQGPADYLLDPRLSRREFGSLLPYSHNRGEWSVEDGNLHVCCSQSAQSFTGRLATADVELCADVTPLRGCACLMVRALGTVRHVLAGFSQPGKVAVLQSGLGGYTVLAEDTLNWRAGQRYRLKVLVEGDSLRLWVDDACVLKTRIPFDHGMVGVGLPDAGEALFGPVHVKER